MNNVRKRRLFDAIVWTVSLLYALWLMADSAMAAPAQSQPDAHTWKAECGSCHIAYAPQLLPASAWRHMLESLDRHFGSDASIDARTAEEIRAFLERGAALGKRASDSGTLRISETPWFRRKHDEVGSSSWRLARSAANCAACHPDAARGEFDEHAVRLPR